MSQENVELVRRANACFNGGDLDGVLGYMHPEVHWRDLLHAPDAPEVVVGIPAVRAIWEQWEDSFEEVVAEFEDCWDARDCVVSATHWRAKGKASGLATDIRSAEIWELTDGLVTRITLGYANAKAALKAVGLEE